MAHGKPPDCSPGPAGLDTLRARLEDSQDTAAVLAKDASQVKSHARALRAQSTRARADACQIRQALPPDTLLSVTQAAAVLGICERTLRAWLHEPGNAPRVCEGTRKAGTFYKPVQLLPPDLIQDLAQRAAKLKPSQG